MNKNYYAVIPANVRYDKELKASSKLLYGEITALSNEKGYCWAKNGYFAELYGVSKETVSRWISQLEKKEYITTEIIYKKETKEIEERRIYIENTYQKSMPIDEKVNTPIDEKVKDNNTFINIKYIYDFWNEKRIVVHRKLTKKMESKIKSILEEYDIDEVRQAISNYSEIVLDDKYYFTHKWTLEEFLQRGLTKFENREIAIQNYLEKELKKDAKKPDVENWRGTDRRF